MGIGFVLLFWGIVGVALTVIGSLVSMVAAEHLASGIRNPYEKRNVVNATRFAPLLYLGWLVVVFVFQFIVNLGIMHRDIGLGDGFDCVRNDVTLPPLNHLKLPPNDKVNL